MPLIDRKSQQIADRPDAHVDFGVAEEAGVCGEAVHISGYLGAHAQLHTHTCIIVSSTAFTL